VDLDGIDDRVITLPTPAELYSGLEPAAAEAFTRWFPRDNQPRNRKPDANSDEV